MNLNVPNLLTLVRLGLIPLFVITMLAKEPGRALLVFSLAGLTDALDGLAARVFRQASALGAYLDPVADKLMLTTAFVILSLEGLHTGFRIPVWVTVVVIARDVLILLVALLLYLALGVTEFPPTRISKLNTALQVAAVVSVLLSGLREGVEAPARVLVHAAGVLTVVSGLDYVYRANRVVALKQRDSA